VQRGAFWLWKEPVEGHEYVLGVDCAEGVGQNGDNSCIQIIDMQTFEQVAEFYSNNISPHDLASIVNELGLLYNNALIAVEDMGPGCIVLNMLQLDFSYENLFYSSRNTKTLKPGIKVTVANRPILLQGFQSRIMNNSLKMKSRRLLREMKTFEFNNTSKKAEAAKGKHDDAIMSMAVAVYARDQSIRDIPLGMAVTDGAGRSTNSAADIRTELRKGLKEDILDRLRTRERTADEFENELLMNMYRKNNALLKEFGWAIGWLVFALIM
jgi:hypothetical protein